MAKASIILMATLVFSLTCSKLFDPVEGIGVVDCAQLNKGLVRMSSDSVATQVNKFTVDLRPISTEEDPWGQEKNLNELIGRLNKNCPDLNAERICYACIKTNPPQSEIMVQADSSGTMVHRVLDILTPDDRTIECIRVHGM